MGCPGCARRRFSRYRPCTSPLPPARRSWVPTHTPSCLRAPHPFPAPQQGGRSGLPPHLSPPHILIPFGCFHWSAGKGDVQVMTHSPSSPQRPEEHPEMWSDLRGVSVGYRYPHQHLQSRSREKSGCTAMGVPLGGWIWPCWHLADMLTGHSGGVFPSSLRAAKVWAAPSPCQT